MTRWLTRPVPCAADPDNAKGVERTTVAQRQEPVGEYPRVYEDHRLPSAPLGVRNLARLYTQLYHGRQLYIAIGNCQCSQNVELGPEESYVRHTFRAVRSRSHDRRASSSWADDQAS